MSKYFIIGASSGIGLCVASQLAEANQQVYATFNKHPINSENPAIQYHYLNVLDENLSIDFLHDAIDGNIYCPGSISLRPFERINPQDFVNDYNLQLIGAIKIMQGAMPRLKKGNLGKGCHTFIT